MGPRITAMLGCILIVGSLTAQRVVPVGTGISAGGFVYALLEHNDRLIIAGRFESFNGNPSRNIQAWDGQTAYDMPGAFSDEGDEVYALVEFQGDLIAAGHDPDNGHVARWNGIEWQSMDAGLSGGTWTTLVAKDDLLFVGGNTGEIRLWNGVAWDLVATVLDGAINAMCIMNDELFVGGSFLNRFVRLVGSDWVEIGGGLNGPVLSMAAIGSNLLIGGAFTSNASGTLSDPYWAQWDGNQLITPAGPGPELPVYHIAPLADGRLILGQGAFRSTLIQGDQAERMLIERAYTSSPFGAHLFIGGANTIIPEYGLVLAQVLEGNDLVELNRNAIRLEAMNRPWWFGRKRMAAQPTFDVHLAGIDHSMIRQVIPMMSGSWQDQNYFSVPPDPNGGPCSGPHATLFDEAHRFKYDQVWVLDRNMIDHHIAHFSDADYTMPNAIETWPGNGDVANGEPYLLAPFEDLNANDTYEPWLGEYPLIRGDQAVYYIQHDGQGWLDEKAMIDRHIMHYAFWNSWDDHLFNTVFTNVKLIDRSGRSYDDIRFGLFLDSFIGCGYDDLVGSDTTLHLSYVYNGLPLDPGCLGTPGYDGATPAVGISWLNVPMTVNTRHWTGAGSGLFIETMTPDTVLNVLHGLSFNGSQIIDPNGTPTTIAFTGDPELGTGWLAELSSPAQPGKVYFTGVGPFSMGPGDTLCVDLAWIYARDSVGGHLASVTKLKEYTAQIRQWYLQNDIQCGGSYGIVTRDGAYVSPAKRMHIFPNPAQDRVSITGIPTTGLALLTISDARGQEVHREQLAFPDGTTSTNVSALRSGWYTVAVLGSEDLWHGRLVITR